MKTPTTINGLEKKSAALENDMREMRKKLGEATEEWFQSRHEQTAWEKARAKVMKIHESLKELEEAFAQTKAPHPTTVGKMSARGGLELDGGVP